MIYAADGCKRFLGCTVHKAICFVIEIMPNMSHGTLLPECRCQAITYIDFLHLVIGLVHHA